MSETAAQAIQSPVFVVSAPRSGSKWLRDALSASPDMVALQGDSHEILESIEALRPENRDEYSHRLTVRDVDSTDLEQLRVGYLQRLQGGQKSGGPRFLDHDAHNALRIPFLKVLFSDSLFIYLYREPRTCIAAIMDAWESGRHVEIPNLPDWEGPPWSLPLIPSWRRLSGKPLVQVAAAQWMTSQRFIQDDLEALPSNRWCAVNYDELVADPAGIVQRLCAFTGQSWDATHAGSFPPLPPPRDLTQLEEDLQSVALRVQPIEERATAVLQEHAPPDRPGQPRVATGPSQQTIATTANKGFPAQLGRLRISLAVATVRENSLVLVRSRDEELNAHLVNTYRPGALARRPGQLAMATPNQIRVMTDIPKAAGFRQAGNPYDACFALLQTRATGPLDIRDMEWGEDGLHFVSTLFSCIGTLDDRHSFIPAWRPPFVSALAAESRCGLTGLALRDGRPKYATCLAESDTPRGWLTRKKYGGLLLDVETNETICRGLSLPHSPRWHRDQLWLLESGRGRLVTVDPESGRVSTFLDLPGFPRGMDFHGPYAFIGLSLPDKDPLTQDIPLAERLDEPACGVWSVNIESGSVGNFLRFNKGFDGVRSVRVLTETLFPQILDPDDLLSRRSVLLPHDALGPQAAEGIAPPPRQAAGVADADEAEVPASIATPTRPLRPQDLRPPEEAPFTVSGTAAAPGPGDEAIKTPRFEQPVFIVSAPRSGGTMLFETLSRSPAVYTVGGEGRQVFEQIRTLNPAHRDYDSNRQFAADADPFTVETLKTRFLTCLRDRDGAALPGNVQAFRLLEKTSKNALRVQFLNAAFPDARFIFLIREARNNISSIMDAWRSRRFVTYPQLPNWPGPKWSLVLIPGWRDLREKPVEEIAAAQWTATNKYILSDFNFIEKERWCAIGYEDFLKDPHRNTLRLCRFAGIEWDRKLEAGLPISRFTLTPPDPDKWKKNAEELERVLPGVEGFAESLRTVLDDHAPPELEESEIPASAPAAIDATPPAEPVTTSSEAVPPQAPPEPQQRRMVVRPSAAPVQVRREAAHIPTSTPTQQEPQMAEQQPPPSQDEFQADGGQRATTIVDFSSSHTTNLVPLLSKLGSTLLVSTYQAGKLIAVRVDNGVMNTHFRNFRSPMGLAVSNNRLALGTKTEVWDFRNQPEVGRKLEPQGKHDACFMPRTTHFTGDIQIHEVAWANDELWIVNTRFSCLCTLDGQHSFVPRWRPPFVTRYSPDDRCHLNGLALVDSKPRYVTALGTTNSAGGWRENKANGGILMDVDSGEVIAEGLSMPHSPRWHDGKLWLLESGKGGLNTVDLTTGKVETVVELPGFTRGLDFFGPLAFVGLSQVRETAVFSGIPITESTEQRYCGVWIVDTRNGQIMGFLRFEGSVQEIFAVQVLRGLRFPELINDDHKIIGSSYVLPDEALKEVEITPSKKEGGQAGA